MVTTDAYTAVRSLGDQLGLQHVTPLTDYLRENPVPATAYGPLVRNEWFMVRRDLCIMAIHLLLIIEKCTVVDRAKLSDADALAGLLLNQLHHVDSKLK